MSKVPVYLLTYFLSVHQAEPVNKIHLTVLGVFCISLLLVLFLLGRWEGGGREGGREGGGEGREGRVISFIILLHPTAFHRFPPIEKLPSSSGYFERHQEPHSLPDFAQSTR